MDRGLRRYFSAKACSNGHISERYTSIGKCVTCASIEARSEKKRKYDRDRYKGNIEENRIKAREYNARNSERRVLAAGDWARKNPELRRAISKSYKARRRAAEKIGDPTSAILAWELSAEKVCHWCKLDCSGSYHIDHYYPLSKGGTHTIENLVIACPGCNLRKSAKDPELFREQLRAMPANDNHG